MAKKQKYLSFLLVGSTYQYVVPLTVAELDASVVKSIAVFSDRLLVGHGKKVATFLHDAFH